MRDVIPPTEGDFGPQTIAVLRVLKELRTADQLTVAMAAVGDIRPDHTVRHATQIAYRAAREGGRAGAWAAAWRAASQLTDSPAAVDRVVAEVVADLVPPEVHRSLSASWAEAVQVRRQLRALGRPAEQLAHTLLDAGWTDPVDGLPDVARGALAA